jgi:hypothetical protein
MRSRLTSTVADPPPWNSRTTKSPNSLSGRRHNSFRRAGSIDAPVDAATHPGRTVKTSSMSAEL